MPKEERDVEIFVVTNDFDAPKRCDGLQRGQSPSLPKGSTWHAAQDINYGSGQRACMHAMGDIIG